MTHFKRHFSRECVARRRRPGQEEPWIQRPAHAWFRIFPGSRLNALFANEAAVLGDMFSLFYVSWRLFNKTALSTCRVLRPAVTSGTRTTRLHENRHRSAPRGHYCAFLAATPTTWLSWGRLTCRRGKSDWDRGLAPPIFGPKPLGV